MGTLELIFAGLLALFSPMLFALLRTEIAVWHDPLIKWLVRRAASVMPEGERMSYEAEWLAVIADTRSPSWKLVQGGSLFLNAKRTANEARKSPRLSASPAELRRVRRLTAKTWFCAGSAIATTAYVCLVIWYSAGPLYVTSACGLCIGYSAACAYYSFCERRLIRELRRRGAQHGTG